MTRIEEGVIHAVLVHPRPVCVLLSASDSAEPGYDDERLRGALQGRGVTLVHAEGLLHTQVVVIGFDGYPGMMRVG